MQAPRDASAANGLCIAHIMPWRTIGGTETATLRLADAMADVGIGSLMYCRTDSPTVASFFRDHGYRTAPYDQALFEAGWPSFLKATGRLGRDFCKSGVDVVACADLRALDTAAGAARLKRIPLVSQIRNPYEWLTPLQRGWLLAANELIFCSHDALRRFGSISRFGPAIAARIANVVYDVVDLPIGHTHEETVRQVADVREELGIPETCKIVGMVARIARQKDHLTLVKAAERVVERHPDVRFVIVGDSGPESLEQQHGRAVRLAAEGSTARGHFIFTGYRADVMRLTTAFDIAVLCTHFEGFGLTNLEAMVLGKPVVATDVGGVPEVVLDGKTGLLHAHEDDVELAEKLLRLLNDDQQAAALGNAGRRFAESRFGVDRFRADMSAIYRRAARTGPRSLVSNERRASPAPIGQSDDEREFGA